jgi:hypothetical protein
MQTPDEQIRIIKNAIIEMKNPNRSIDISFLNNEKENIYSLSRRGDNIVIDYGKTQLIKSPPDTLRYFKLNIINGNPDMDGMINIDLYRDIQVLNNNGQIETQRVPVVKRFKKAIEDIKSRNKTKKRFKNVLNDIETTPPGVPLSSYPGGSGYHKAFKHFNLNKFGKKKVISEELKYLKSL